MLPVSDAYRKYINQTNCIDISCSEQTDHVTVTRLTDFPRESGVNSSTHFYLDSLTISYYLKAELVY